MLEDKNSADVKITPALGKIITKLLSHWSVKCSGAFIKLPILSLRSLFCLFLTGHFTQVLLYCVVFSILGLQWFPDDAFPVIFSKLNLEYMCCLINLERDKASLIKCHLKKDTDSIIGRKKRNC